MRRDGPSRLGTVGWTLIGIVAITASATAADYYVNTTADTNDGICMNLPIPPFNCSLRDAVINANSHAEADTIHIPAGDYFLTIAQTPGPGDFSGDLDITNDVEIRGMGTDVTVIHNTLEEYAFYAEPDFQGDSPLLQLLDLTIRGGGGGVFSRDAIVILSRSEVEMTQSTDLTGTSIEGRDSTVLVVDSTVRGNQNTVGGGGIAVFRSVLWVLRSTIANNRAHFFGAGVWCEDTTATFTNATLTGNRLYPGDGNGGLFARNCDVLITGSTLAGNPQYDLELEPTLPGTVTLRNTYIGSQCPLGTADAVTSEGGNVGSPNCGFYHPSDIDFSGGTAILLPMGDYGGHTPTMPPRGIPNPLVDNAGANPNCLSDDQRGVPRPQDGGSGTALCDTGAVERTHIFIDGFESGDTSGWSSTVP